MKILIADDERAVLTVLSHHIRKYHAPFTEILQAKNGEELFLICKERKPDIVFTDIRMPAMNGLEALEALRNEEGMERTSFYLMSGYNDFAYVRTALRLQACDYLLKPIQYAEVEKILQKEERKHYVGVDPARYRQAPDERTLFRLSTLLQDMALDHARGDWRNFADTLEDWKKEAIPTNLGIDPVFLHAKLGVESPPDDTVEDQYKRLKTLANDPSHHSDVRDPEVVARYIDDHYCDIDFGLDKLASFTGYSAPYLSMLCKKTWGKNFSDYLTEKRMEKARHLLEESNLLVKDIAASCGYAHPAYFIKRFSSFFGMTPELFRNRNLT